MLNPSGFTVGTYYVGATPKGIAIDKAGSVFVVNTNANTVTKLSQNGSILRVYPVGTAPDGIAIDAFGNIWVTNSGSNTVTKI